MPALSNLDPSVVAISTPPECQPEQIVYAQMLYNALEAKKIPVVGVSSLMFRFDSQKNAEDLRSLMDSQVLPHVYIGGKIKGRPTKQQVFEELRLQGWVIDP